MHMIWHAMLRTRTTDMMQTLSALNHVTSHDPRSIHSNRTVVIIRGNECYIALLHVNPLKTT